MASPTGTKSFDSVTALWRSYEIVFDLFLYCEISKTHKTEFKDIDIMRKVV